MALHEVVIIGAGGHGKVVLDILRAAGGCRIAGFVDADPGLVGSTVAGVPVLGQINLLPKLKQQKIRHAIVAIGDNRSRLQYVRTLIEHGFELVSAIHPTSHVSPTATLAAGVVLAPMAVVGTEARIGTAAIINTAAVVDHECEIAEAAHIGPGALLAGRVRVETGAFVGLGAKVIQCLTIGPWSMVAAGAVVIRDVDPNATVMGVPARSK